MARKQTDLGRKQAKGKGLRRNQGPGFGVAPHQPITEAMGSVKEVGNNRNDNNVALSFPPARLSVNLSSLNPLSHFIFTITYE